MKSKFDVGDVAFLPSVIWKCVLQQIKKITFLTMAPHPESILLTSFSQSNDLIPVVHVEYIYCELGTDAKGVATPYAEAPSAATPRGAPASMHWLHTGTETHMSSLIMPSCITRWSNTEGIRRTVVIWFVFII